MATFGNNKQINRAPKPFGNNKETDKKGSPSKES